MVNVAADLKAGIALRLEDFDEPTHEQEVGAFVGALLDEMTVPPDEPWEQLGNYNPAQVARARRLFIGRMQAIADRVEAEGEAWDDVRWMQILINALKEAGRR